MYLNCHTYYSLRFGTFSEIVLLKMAQAKGVQHIALTDINNTSACLNFIRKAADYNVQPIIGIDFRNGAKICYVGLAKSNQGFQALNAFLSEHTHQKKALPEQAPDIQDGVFIYPFETILELEKVAFRDNEYIGIAIHDLRRLPFSTYKNYKERLVIMQSVTFRNKRDFNAHRLLRAIDNNTLLSKLQQTEQAQDSEKMLPLEELLAAYSDYPHIIANTEKLIASCTIEFEFGKDRISQNLKVYGTSESEDYQQLVRLCNQGMPKRYPKLTPTIQKRLETELATIKSMNFVAYFLINHDIVNYAKSQDYFYVGRGSGANSMVAYIIGITDVDPIELDLYFERFINPYRASPPDFDIDFSWKDREDVTAYIFKRFPNTALLATYNTFKYRAVVRELGKVFGLPKETIDKLSDGHYQVAQLDQMEQLVLKYLKP